MKYTARSIKYLLFIITLAQASYCNAINAINIEQQSNPFISELYHRLNNMPKISIGERIDWISQQFKGSPYYLGSLGEGANARYDQYPMYRVDAFDCDTFVNTVIALALEHSLNSFKQSLINLRYKNGDPSYLNRNHFQCIDWNKNNQKRGVLKDITPDIHDKKNKSVAQSAEALIDKPSWYSHKTIENIRLQNGSTSLLTARLTELKSKGKHLKVTLSIVPYIPLTQLFMKNSKPNMYLFSQIPNGSIIEIVRPNWDLRERIGTALNVSHLGFAIWIKNQLYFRQASSQYGKVVDVPLINYLMEAQNSPTIKGINIQIVRSNS